MKLLFKLKGTSWNLALKTGVGGAGG